MAQRLVDEGSMTKEIAKTSSLSHMLVSSIGRGKESLHPDAYKTTLELGDTVLLCTDGLTDRVSDVEIAEILSGNTSEQAASQTLIDAANAAGGNDNITVIVSRYLLN
jgi:protein phosphatase